MKRFDAPTTLSVLFKVVNEAPPLPSMLNSNVDHELEAACLKAMANDPADRYEGARQMRAALRAVQKSLEMLTRPDGRQRRSAATLD